MKLQTFRNVFAVAALGLALSFSARGQSREETWSAGGGAWTPANQPGWTNGVGGTLNSDISADFGAEITASGANSGGIYSVYYYSYSLFSTPAFTLSTSSVLDDVGTIAFSLVSNGAFSSSSAALDFSGTQPVASFSVVDTGEVMSGSSLYRYTWAWDVGAVSAGRPSRRRSAVAPVFTGASRPRAAFKLSGSCQSSAEPHKSRAPRSLKNCNFVVARIS